MVNHAHKHYSNSFKRHADDDIEILTFYQNLHQKVDDLPSKPFLFQMLGLVQSIQTLKSKTSAGHEKVSDKLIKLLARSHCSFILITLNSLLVKNESFNHWKKGEMILLPKDKTTLIDINNTRPISLLPCLGKLYEKSFLIYLRKWMTDNNILPSEQSGLRSAHSTTTRFTQFIQDVSTSLQQHIAALILYTDFSKAFDQLWRRGLIYKLHKLRCPKELL
ncbi:unnamed protein product [Didymodactylos carnosus]|uniref:Reverse transcriptase domain-containing protein n=1 Tax=Didymodactylos carnosus TaxID=1234261 RepID=A0A8S2DRV3_9BILA|nr:unnamed protein product [Didymodactylos carnosus]CAF3785425.1 unnamed protein product [Didymodactylos carnosus]